jgi:hypothetical protein
LDLPPCRRWGCLACVGVQPGQPRNCIRDLGSTTIHQLAAKLVGFLHQLRRRLAGVFLLIDGVVHGRGALGNWDLLSRLLLLSGLLAGR